MLTAITPIFRSSPVFSSLAATAVPIRHFATTLTRQLAIPASQKAMVFERNGGPITYRDIPVPTPKSNEILVNVKYSGVCHTDLHAWKGDWPLATKLPLVGGHEGAGVVVAVGDAVKNFKIGDLAGIKWLNGSCQACEFCEQGNESNCAEADLSGYTHDGSFQQFATADAVQAAKLPENTNLAEIAPILCAGVTVYKAIKTADLKAGDWLAISGAGGGLGTLAIQYAKAMGYKVLAIDGGEDKAKLCTELGADVFVDFTKSKNIVEEIQEKTHGGPNGVINVSVSEKAIAQSCQYVRACGTVVLVGLPAGAVASTPVFDAVVKSISIRGSYVGNRADTREAVNFFVDGKVKSPIQIIPLRDLTKVYDEMADGKVLGRYVLDCTDV